MNDTLFKAWFAAKVFFIQLDNAIQGADGITMGFHHGTDGWPTFQAVF